MSDREDLFALEALEATVPLEPRDLDDASLAREYTELAGLLALDADEVAPRAEVKDAIFSAIRGAANEPAPSEASAVSEMPSNVVSMPIPAAATPAWTTWAAAAGLLAALSFAALSGFLFSRLQIQGEAIAQLEEEVVGLEQQRDLVGAAEDGLARRVDLVTSTSAEVCALKPAGESPAQPQARALFWADTESRRWVLSASQLERCPLGREYRIWFVGEDGTFSGGAFRVKGPDERIEIEADEMPPGTEKVLVTLEFPEKVGEEPGGELILYGDETRQIL